MRAILLTLVLIFGLSGATHAQGDQIEATIAGIGTLKSPVVAD